MVGNLSDRFGRRRVLLVSLTTMVLTYVMMGLAQSLWLLFVARVIAGISAANHSTAAAVIADISAPKERAANFGLLGAAFGIGFILGPVIGGLAASYGPRAPFFVAAVLAGVVALIGVFAMKETVTNENRRAFEVARALPWGAFRQVAKLAGQGRMLLVLFFQEVAFLAYPIIWAYFTIAKFGWSEWLVGLSLGVFGLTMALSQGVLIRYVMPRLGEYRTAVLGLSVEVISFIGVALAPTTWVIFALMPLSAIGMLAGPAMQGILSRAVPDNAQGELQGVVGSVRAFAAILAPPVIAGLFWVFSDDGWLFSFAGAPFILSALLVLVAIRILQGHGRASGIAARA